jgi:hypothetical protein
LTTSPCILPPIALRAPDDPPSAGSPP